MAMDCPATNDRDVEERTGALDATHEAKTVTLALALPAPRLGGRVALIVAAPAATAVTVKETELLPGETTAEAGTLEMDAALETRAMVVALDWTGEMVAVSETEFPTMAGRDEGLSEIDAPPEIGTLASAAIESQPEALLSITERSTLPETPAVKVTTFVVAPAVIDPFPLMMVQV